MQDVLVGDKTIDNRFVFKGNQPKIIKELFKDFEIRKILYQITYFNVQIGENDAFLNDFPEQTNQLFFQKNGVIKNEDELITLLNIFKVLLDRMIVLDLAKIPFEEN